MKAFSITLFSLLACLPLSAASVIVSFAAEATAGDLAGVSSNPNVTAALVSRGSDLIPRTDFSGYFDSENWSTSSTFEGIESGSYLSFSFMVDANYLWSPSSLSIAYQDAGSQQAARRLQLRFSGDDFGSIHFLDTSVNAYPGPNDINEVDLSGLDPLSGLVEFRLYGFGALNANGVLGLANDPALDFAGAPHALLISGDLVVIPEPAAWLFMPAILGAFAAIQLRHQRKARTDRRQAELQHEFASSRHRATAESRVSTPSFR